MTENNTEEFNKLSAGAMFYIKKRWPGEKDTDQLLVYIEKELNSICWTPFSKSENLDIVKVAPKKAKSSRLFGLIFILFGVACLFIVPSSVMGWVYLFFFAVMGGMMHKRGTSILYLLEAYLKFKA